MSGVADLSDELKLVIDRYLDGHRSRSLATLSRSAGVSYTTLRRFAQREGQPTAEPVLKIVDATLGTDEKIDFLRRHFPEIARAIQNIDTKQYNRPEPTNESLRACYNRDPHNLIHNMASTNHGTTVERIKELCGRRGLEALDEMVELELLTRDFETGKVSVSGDGLLIFDCEMALSNIERSAKYFDRSLIGTEFAKVGHMATSLNPEGMIRIHRLLAEAVANIIAVKDDPKYWGEVPLFVNLMMNVYDRGSIDVSEETGDGDH